MRCNCGHERHNHHENGHGACILCHCAKFREKSVTEDDTQPTIPDFFAPSSTPTCDPPSDPSPAPDPSPSTDFGGFSGGDSGGGGASGDF